MNSIRALFLMISLITGISCVYIGNSESAIGMGIISGMSILATGVTYIGKQEE
ncbi:hypothetical protein KORDIASMS9_04608 [Kordia sp. SMS9]|nr:hypothetical protein KORDIASMS9_04608 [Kordia sp. SMS9]